MRREELILEIQNKHVEYTGRKLIGLCHLSTDRLTTINNKLDKILTHYSQWKTIRRKYTIDEWINYSLSDNQPDEIRRAFKEYNNANHLYATLSSRF